MFTPISPATMRICSRRLASMCASRKDRKPKIETRNSPAHSTVASFERAETPPQQFRTSNFGLRFSAFDHRPPSFEFRFSFLVRGCLVHRLLYRSDHRPNRQLHVWHFLRVPSGAVNRESGNGQELGGRSQSDQEIDELVHATAEVRPSRYERVSYLEFLSAKELTAADLDALAVGQLAHQTLPLGICQKRRGALQKARLESLQARLGSGEMGRLKLRVSQQSLVPAKFHFPLLDHLGARAQVVQHWKDAEVEQRE